MHDLEAKDSSAKKAALERLQLLVSVGEKHQATVIQRALQRTIVDRLVDPRAATMTYQLGGLLMNYPGSFVTISNHALSQMCGVTGIPKLYVNKLMGEFIGMKEAIRSELIVHLFNTHFHEGVYLDRKKHRAKFLHRVLDGKLHGFLSRSFNRKLGTVAMMRPFLEECSRHGAKPTQALTSELKTSIKCVLPVIFEPIAGEFVAIGATYTNSDFGSGSLEVSGSILRVSTGSTSVLQSKMKKIHLGALITDSEIELSEATMEKESSTHSSAVRDMVNYVFSPQNVEETLALVKLAAESKLRWDQVAGRAKDTLTKAELEKLETLLQQTHEGIIDLPPVTLNKAGDMEASAWWASAALGQIAAETADVEHKIAIQGLAGDLLK